MVFGQARPGGAGPDRRKAPVPRSAVHEYLSTTGIGAALIARSTVHLCEILNSNECPRPRNYRDGCGETFRAYAVIISAIISAE